METALRFLVVDSSFTSFVSLGNSLHLNWIACSISLLQRSPDFCRLWTLRSSMGAQLILTLLPIKRSMPSTASVVRPNLTRATMASLPSVVQVEPQPLQAPPVSPRCPLHNLCLQLHGHLPPLLHTRKFRSPWHEAADPRRLRQQKDGANNSGSNEVRPKRSGSG